MVGLRRFELQSREPKSRSLDQASRQPRFYQKPQNICSALQYPFPWNHPRSTRYRDKPYERKQHTCCGNQQMSASFFYRHRTKFAAFFYFVGSVQIINYLTTKLPPILSSPFLSYLSASALFSLLWDIVMGIGLGILFLAAGWLMASIFKASETGQRMAEPSAGNKNQ